MNWEEIAKLKGPRGFTGKPGERGLPGLEDVPTDPGIAELIGAGRDSETGSALLARFERPELVNPRGLDRWRRRLGQAFFSRAEVIVAGSSTVDGAWADDTGVRDVETQWRWAERGFVGHLRRLFAGQYGHAGEGFMSFPGDDMRWTLAGATRDDPTAFAATGVLLGSGGSAQIDLRAGTSAVHVWAAHERMQGAIRTIVDGQDATPTVLSGVTDALTGGWQSSQATVDYTTETTQETFNLVRAVVTTAGNVVVRTPSGAAAPGPVTAGTWYQVQAGVRCATSIRPVACSLVFFDAAGAQVGSEQAGDFRTNTLTTQYQQVVATVQAPEGAVRAAVFIRVQDAQVGDEVRVRYVKVAPLLTRIEGADDVIFTRYRVPITTGTGHTVRLLNGPGTSTHLLGIVHHTDGAAGIQIHGYGKSGSTVDPHAGVGLDQDALQNQMIGTFGLFNPALCIGLFGSNDYNRQSEFGTQEAFKAKLQVWVDAAVARGASVLLFAGTHWDNTRPIPQAEYNQVMREIAETNPHVAYADLSDAWGGFRSADAKGFMWDSPHANSSGHGDLARIIYQVITRPTVPEPEVP